MTSIVHEHVRQNNNNTTDGHEYHALFDIQDFIYTELWWVDFKWKTDCKVSPTEWKIRVQYLTTSDPTSIGSAFTIERVDGLQILTEINAHLKFENANFHLPCDIQFSDVLVGSGEKIEKEEEQRPGMFLRNLFKSPGSDVKVKVYLKVMLCHSQLKEHRPEETSSRDDNMILCSKI